MAIEYNFKYTPLVGKLSGESMVKQTETAINEIAEIVNENTAQAEIINTLAETANSNSVEALEKANEALETSGRVYITETLAVNVDSYCESQLIYINNAFSQNLPIAHKGFLEVKTNDDKTQATQVFADDVDRKFYVRTGAITESTVGDVTTYTASYGEWTNIPNSTDLANYLPVAGGTMSGDIEYSASEFAIKGSDISNDGEVSIIGATDNLNGASLTLYGRNHTESGAFELSANNGTLTKTLKGTASGSLQWDGKDVATTNYVQSELLDYLALTGGDITGDLSVSGNLTVEGIITGNVTGNVSGNANTATNAVNATNDANGNPIASTYLPLAGGTMTGDILWENEDSDVFGIGFSDTNKDTVDIGWTYNDKNGAGIGLRNVSHNDGGVFNLWATNGTNTKTFVGKADGTLKWDGSSIAVILALGSAPNNVTTNFTLPSSGSYLLITGHNSSPGMNGIWAIRTGGNSAFKLAGGGDVTITCSNTTVSVKPTAGSAGVWAIQLPFV